MLEQKDNEEAIEVHPEEILWEEEDFLEASQENKNNFTAEEIASEIKGNANEELNQNQS